MSLAGAREALDRLVRDVPDYPEPGVVFKDITPLLADHTGLAAVVAGLAHAGRDEAGRPVVDVVVGMEARGFILGAPVALALGAGFVPVRKAGKLPRETHAVSARATVDLVERCGAEVVGVAVLMDLAFLPWREALGDVAVTTLMSVGAEPSLDAP